MYADRHTHASCNAVPLVWGSLRLAPISGVYRNLKDQMKLDFCIREALSYEHITMETAFDGSITTNIN